MNYLYFNWCIGTLAIILITALISHLFPIRPMSFIESGFVAYVVIWCDLNKGRNR